jgi:hypothetical protein
MKDIGERLKHDAHIVIERWQTLVRESPLAGLPPDHDIDHLPGVIAGLAEAALCRPSDVEAHRSNTAAAAIHGEHRRRHGFPDSVIFSEFHLLHHALWSYLRESTIGEARTSAAILRLDAELALDTTASLCGYHREELTQSGRWPMCIELLAEESPLLRLPPAPEAL